MLARQIWIYVLVICTTVAKAQSITQCVSSCGDIHDIHFPFKLKADPLDCGVSGFELDCQKNRTAISLYSKKYFMLEINYHEFLIRKVDPGLKHHTSNCTSLPDYFNTSVRSTSIFYRTSTPEYNYLKSTSGTEVIVKHHDRNFPTIYVSCLAPVNSSRYVETTFCGSPFSNSSRSHSYVASGQDMSVSDLDENCIVEMVAWASSHCLSGDNTSLSSIHAALTYGF